MTPFEATIYAYDAAGRRIARAHSGTAFAQGIPALTPATGRVRFRSQIIGAGNNYDENQDDDEIGIARPNLWPVGGTYGESWCHSDMRDIAYFYVFKFYEKATEKGKLK